MPELGLTLIEPAAPGSARPGTALAAVRAAAGGTLPEAALLTHGGPGFRAEATAFQGSGVQLLGTALAFEGAVEGDAALDGAWFAAPDPYAFDAFAASFAAVYRRRPRRLAALAYDAVRIARTLAVAPAGDLGARALVASAGFRGVAGGVRFRAGNSCIRELAIVTREAGKPKLIGRRAGA